MIGMIAFSIIATRNAIFTEFVEDRKKEGKPLSRSLIEAGALRTRAIFLTCLSAMLDAWPMTFCRKHTTSTRSSLPNVCRIHGLSAKGITD
jgi:multidrug efflux pump subunit AcrB